MNLLDINNYSHLEPERWADWAAEYLDTNIETPATRLVVMKMGNDAMRVDDVLVFFDLWYVAFKGADVLTSEIKNFDTLRDCYVLPGICSIQKHIESVGAEAEKVIFRPVTIDAINNGAWSRTAVVNNTIISAYLAKGRGDEATIVLQTCVGFKLREPPTTVDEYRQRLDKIWPLNPRGK